MKAGCTLIDGVVRSAANPVRFQIPTGDEKAAVASGDHVKIGVEMPSGRGERFWVKVSSKDGDLIHGVVDNDLVYTDEHGLDDTDAVSFEPRHILDIL